AAPFRVAAGARLAAGLRQAAAEMDAAARVQGRLLADPPAVPGFDLGAACRPARAAAGDFFDVFRMPGGAVGVALGDVCGHGLGPALLAASVRAYLRALPGAGGDVGEGLTAAQRFRWGGTADRVTTALPRPPDPAGRRGRGGAAGRAPRRPSCRGGGGRPGCRARARRWASTPARRTRPGRPKLWRRGRCCCCSATASWRRGRPRAPRSAWGGCSRW